MLSKQILDELCSQVTESEFQGPSVPECIYQVMKEIAEENRNAQKN
jgi:hypothetical protein